MTGLEWRNYTGPAGCGSGPQQCQEVDGILVLPFSAFYPYCTPTVQEVRAVGRELWQKSLARPLTQARHGFFLVRGPESHTIAIR